MRNRNFRCQMFRFVDIVPCLDTSEGRALVKRARTAAWAI